MDTSGYLEEAQPLTLVASLELPSMLYSRGSHLLRGHRPASIHTFSSPLYNETSGCQKHNCGCGWHKTFELMDECRTLSVHINEWSRGPGGSSFYIPFKTLLNYISSRSTAIASNSSRVPWDEWAQDVSWMVNGLIGRMDISDAHRAQSRQKGLGETWPNGDFRIYVQNFNPCAVRWAAECTNRGVLGPNTCVRWPDMARTTSGELLENVPRLANNPFVETYLDFDGLSERMRGQMSSSVVMFEDSSTCCHYPSR